MRKMRLELDELDVETFEVPEGEVARGTVHGHVQSGTPGLCSMSIYEKCFLPSDTQTADVWAGACNTVACGDGGGGLSDYGCNSAFLC